MKAIKAVILADEPQIKNELGEMSDDQLIVALDEVAWLKSEILETIRYRGLDS